MPETGWRISPSEEELLLEFWKNGEMALIISIEPDGIGYAFRKGNRFEPGSCEPSENFAGAMREIDAFINAA